MTQILIVDDEQPICELLQHIFEILRPAYQIQTISDSTVALHHLQQHAFDLVITDYQMPEMTGLDLAQQIYRQWPETQVLLMTGRPPADLRLRLRQWGITEYLKKPFTPAQLLRAVDQVLEQQNGVFMV